MVTRERRSWKLDSQGHYARQIGWKTAENGKRVQHKFRLGADLTEAKRREEKLRQIWASIERCSSEPLPVWTPFSLDVARRYFRLSDRPDPVLPGGGSSDAGDQL